MPRQHPIKLALHKFNTDPIRYEVASRETVPFLAHAKLKIKLLHRREVYAWSVLLQCTRWVYWEKARGVEKPRDLCGLEIKHNCQRRVIVVPECENPHDGDGGGGDDDREREVAED
jgi:hypothetical protein